jgi:uncharacterized protein
MSKMKTIAATIAEELAVSEPQVAAAVTLLDDDATVPFIARYRKEATGGLDDVQLRQLEERLHYLRELADRRNVILKSIADQDKLTPDLEASICAAGTKTRLEDLYLPYKPKRRTKAQMAREAGVEPLAVALLEDPSQRPEQLAAGYVDASKGVADVRAALEGARHILMERFAEEADLVGRLREYLWERGQLCATVVDGKQDEGAKFRDYFDYQEPIRAIPSHRALALFRGRNEGILNLVLALPEADEQRPHALIASRFGIEERGRLADEWLQDTVRSAWKIKILSRLETELKARLRESAEEAAIGVFAKNLYDLLLAAPAGPRTTIGLDPGLRTGVKVAVTDATGKLVATTTIYPHAPRNRWDDSIATLAALARRHRVELIAIGNGTASRETDRLAADLIKRHPELKLTRMMVSESGASVYSASELASHEFPALDVSLRGAVSIARRLQDPLAELVKIDPKAIGVGQYQHDVSQTRLARALDATVEDCVNAVGVDVNIASAPLLSRVSGLNQTLAANIVAFRDANGSFDRRAQLKKVPRLGAKAYEQAAGFLRIMNGANPLDGSAVHPEAYPVVQRISERTGRALQSLIGDSGFLSALQPNDYTDERFGEPTVRGILNELDKPGRDPRPEFRAAVFKEGVETLHDLKPGMILEGTVTNVTNFGAFVDVGVHQDGLVHISQLANRFVKDPRDVVKAGDLVQAKVLEVDVQRKRIALSLRLEEKTERKADQQATQVRRQPAPTSPAHRPTGAIAEALERALKR